MHANSMIKKNISKEMTLEDLIRMVAKGFENTATKDDFQQLTAKMDDRFNSMEVRLDFIQMDIVVVRKELSVLAKRTKEDDSVFVKDILKLRARI